MPWRECLARYDRPHTLLYLDPPYWQAEGYGVPFRWSEYVSIAEAVRDCKGKAIVSLNDHPDIRRVFEGLWVEAVDVTYTVGGPAAERRELVICNWNAGDQGGLFS